MLLLILGFLISFLLVNLLFVEFFNLFLEYIYLLSWRLIKFELPTEICRQICKELDQRNWKAKIIFLLLFYVHSFCVDWNCCITLIYMPCPMSIFEIHILVRFFFVAIKNKTTNFKILLSGITVWFSIIIRSVIFLSFPEFVLYFCR